MISKKRHVLIAFAVAITGSLLYFYFDPAYSRYFPPCPFHTLTGLFCPGCGSQRAFHDLLHGNVLSSADHNLLFTAALPILGYSAVAQVSTILFGKRMGQHLFYSTGFAVLVLVLVTAFWLLRNVNSVPFTWLAP